MKNKSLKYFLSIFIVSIFGLVNVYAIDFPQNARPPQKIPAEGDKLYATSSPHKLINGQYKSVKFDYSKISFKDSNGNISKGKDKMEKIILSTDFLKTGDKYSLDDNWFSAYCLDGRKKYPTGFSYSQYMNSGDETTAQIMADNLVLSAIYNQVNNNLDLYNEFKKYENIPSKTISAGYTYNENNPAEFIRNVINGITKSVQLNTLTLHTDTGTIQISEENLSKIFNQQGKLDLYQNNKELFTYNVYNTKAIDTKKYDRALWIIENSYPTLTIEQTLLNAGVDYNKLVEEIKKLHSNENIDDDIANYIENYIYSTIQYSIWKIYDGLEDKIGDELVGSEELNKLFKYLVNGSKIVETTKYVSENVDGSLTIIKPDTKKEIVEKTKKTLKYGPYSVKVNALNTPKVELYVEKNGLDVKILDKNGDEIKSTNKNGNEITIISPGQQFYVLVDRSDEKKISGVKIKINVNDIAVFIAKENRARIYYPAVPQIQNVITGGLTDTISGAKSFTLTYNPETGVQNIAILFIITLISFSIGYLVLNHKNQSLEL